MMCFSIQRSLAGWLARFLLMAAVGLVPLPLRAEDSPTPGALPAIAPEATPTIVPSATPTLSPLTAPVTAPAAPPEPTPAAASAAWQLPRPGPTEAVISKIVGQLMPRVHYQRLPMDAELSAKFFTAFFDRLDHDRSFFLATDLDEFGREKEKLCDMVLQGKLEFAYAVYERFVQRVRERVDFTRELVKLPFDYSTDEQILIERSKEPWCADQAAMDQLWRLKIKNHMLSFILMDEQQKRDEQAPAQEAAAAPGGPAPDQERKPTKTPEERVVDFFERYLHALEENESMDVLEIFLTSLPQVYDPHSAYMAPSSQEEFNISMSLKLQGIGAVLSSEDGYIKIVELIPGGPADLDGRLQEGDRITAVAQQKTKPGNEPAEGTALFAEPVDIINMPVNKAVHLIRGPKATKVKLTIISADKGLNSLPTSVILLRDEVKLTEAEAKSELRPLAPLPGQPADTPTPKAAVIALPSFYSDFDARKAGDKEFKSATRDVRLLLEKANADQVAGVILDLRFDGGGSLDEAVNLAGLFFPKGPVVQVRNAQREVKVQADTDGETVYGGPLVILVNRLSASASEIVAAALQDYRRAVIIGDASTHGKGTVQTLHQLEAILKRSSVFQNQKPGSLKFTMAKFYRVNGGSTQLKGVIPDVIFSSFSDYMEVGENMLPNALPWDEIEPLKVTPFADVSPYLPLLKQRSQERRSNSPDCKEFAQQVDHYAQLRQTKYLSLNRFKREQLQKEEEDFSKKIKQLTSSRKKHRQKPKPEADEPPARDTVLDEALNVLGDLIALENSSTQPTTAAAGPAAPPATSNGVNVGK